MSAGPVSWQGLCKQSTAAPLRLVPFLPQDNSAELGSSTGTSRSNTELGRLLGLDFPTFLSFVLEDEALGKFVDTFLRCVVDRKGVRFYAIVGGGPRCGPVYGTVSDMMTTQLVFPSQVFQPYQAKDAERAGKGMH